jgi:hypothetical protein
MVGKEYRLQVSDIGSNHGKIAPRKGRIAIIEQKMFLLLDYDEIS